MKSTNVCKCNINNKTINTKINKKSVKDKVEKKKVNDKCLLKKQRRKKLKQNCIDLTKNNNNVIDVCSEPNNEFESEYKNSENLLESNIDTVPDFKNFCDEMFNPDYYVPKNDLLNSQLY